MNGRGDSIAGAIRVIAGDGLLERFRRARYPSPMPPAPIGARFSAGSRRRYSRNSRVTFSVTPRLISGAKPAPSVSRPSL